MPADQIFPDASTLTSHLQNLRARRQQEVESAKLQPRLRRPLTKPERAQILLKSGGRCHICGGTIDGSDWEADHVFAHSAGGLHSLDNYLPAHALCNNYRWNYTSEEFQWILKLGVWLRTQIQNETTVGIAAARQFVEADRKRAARRKHAVAATPQVSLAQARPQRIRG